MVNWDVYDSSIEQERTKEQIQREVIALHRKIGGWLFGYYNEDSLKLITDKKGNNYGYDKYYYKDYLIDAILPRNYDDDIFDIGILGMMYKEIQDLKKEVKKLKIKKKTTKKKVKKKWISKPK